MRVRGAGREGSATFPCIYLLPSVNSVGPSWGRPQPHTLGDSVFGRSETLARLPLFPGLNEGTAKTRLPDKMTGWSFRVMDGTQRRQDAFRVLRGLSALPFVQRRARLNPYKFGPSASKTNIFAACQKIRGRQRETGPRGWGGSKGHCPLPPTTTKA